MTYDTVGAGAMLFAELSPGEWLSVAGAVGGGIATAGAAVGAAIRYVWNQYDQHRTREREHELKVIDEKRKQETQAADAKRQWEETLAKQNRENEAAIAAKFTESAERIQQQAADDNRKALEDGRNAFGKLIEIQATAMKAIAAVVGAVEKLEAAVTELRTEVTGVARGRNRGPKRPRAEEDSR